VLTAAGLEQEIGAVVDDFHALVGQAAAEVNATSQDRLVIPKTRLVLFPLKWMELKT
jgi:hypothetical protein